MYGDEPGWPPVAAGGLIGRAGDLVAVGRGLRGARLVTVIGPPGVGKTAVAAAVAASVATAVGVTPPDGVLPVQLAGVHDGALLAAAVARELDVPETAGDTAEALVDALRDRDLLLVLDTCEHLADACAGLVTRLLRGCPYVRILATGREPLRTADEHIVPVTPLPTRDAITLFARRAAEVRPGFKLNPTYQVKAAMLCRKLDGLPLAIELAAGRMDLLTIDQLLKDLDEGFHLLRARGAVPHRHRTLRAAIGWSHRLCTPGERMVWARLSVFGVPFTMADAAEVCAGERMGRAAVAEAVIGLVDRCVLLVEDATDGGRRFRLPETIRVYGDEMLHLSGDAPGTRARYAAWCARRAP